MALFSDNDYIQRAKYAAKGLYEFKVTIWRIAHTERQHHGTDLVGAVCHVWANSDEEAIAFVRSQGTASDKPEWIGHAVRLEVIPAEGR